MLVVVIHFPCSSVRVRRCEFFGHVQIFRSYSFGHLEWVEWLFLEKTQILRNIERAVRVREWKQRIEMKNVQTMLKEVEGGRERERKS